MPIVDLTNPIYLCAALVLFLLCLFLSRNSKSNTAMCIVLLAFLAILTGHVVELINASAVEAISDITKNLVIDEAFIFISFLSFLWVDKMQIENKTKGKKEEKTVKDGLDFLWKKV